MKRKIVAIDMVDSFNGDDSRYEVGKQVNDNLEVTHITFKRDGLQVINHRDESCYLIRLVNELNKEEAVFKMIPAKLVSEVTFIEKEEKEQEVKVEKVS